MPIGFTRPEDEILADKARLNRAEDEAGRGNWQTALDLAHGIEEDWYRCQALAAIAVSMPKSQRRLDVLEEALEAGASTEEPNRIVTVSAWPAESLAKLREFQLLDIHVRRILEVAESEPHPVRRSDGLYCLLDFLLRSPAPDSIVHPIFGAFWKASKAGHGWKRDRNLRDAAVSLFEKGWRTESEACVNLIEKGKVRRQATRRIEAI